MNTLEIKTPAIGHIIVIGPVGCGKSIILDRIEKALSKEFNMQICCKDLDIERNCNDLDNLAEHEIKMVQDTIWIMSEPLSKK